MPSISLLFLLLFIKNFSAVANDALIARCGVAATETQFELMTGTSGLRAKVYRQNKLVVQTTQVTIEGPVQFGKEEYRKNTEKQAQKDFGVAPQQIERFVHVRFTDTKRADLYSVFMFKVNGAIQSGWFVGPFKNESEPQKQQLCKKL